MYIHIHIYIYIYIYVHTYGIIVYTCIYIYIYNTCIHNVHTYVHVHANVAELVYRISCIIRRPTRYAVVLVNIYVGVLLLVLVIVIVIVIVIMIVMCIVVSYAARRHGPLRIERSAERARRLVQEFRASPRDNLELRK